MLLVIIHLIEQVFPYIYAFRRYVRIIILIAMCFFLHLNFDGDHHIYILSYCSIRVRRSMSIYIYLWYWETKPRSIDLDEIFCLEIWCYRWLRQNSSQWFFFFTTFARPVDLSVFHLTWFLLSLTLVFFFLFFLFFIWCNITLTASACVKEHQTSWRNMAEDSEVSSKPTVVLRRCTYIHI